MSSPDHDIPALGIRQPWAELILRGDKTLEVRSQQTAQRGTIYIYTSKKLAEIDAAGRAIDEFKIDVATLPLGLVVGTVEIVGSRPCVAGDAAAACVPAEYLKNHFAWELANPTRLAEPLPVRFLPYGIWFYPWKRRNGGTSRRKRGERPA